MCACVRMCVWACCILTRMKRGAERSQATLLAERQSSDSWDLNVAYDVDFALEPAHARAPPPTLLIMPLTQPEEVRAVRHALP